MISSTSNSTSLLSYLAAQAKPGADKAGATQTGTPANTPAGITAKAAANTSTLSQDSLLAAARTTRASISERTLDQQQAGLANDLQAAMKKAGVMLGGSVQFTLGSDGKLALAGSDADKAAMGAFLKADTGRPSLSTRISTLTGDANKLSANIRQHAAISQAARYGSLSSNLATLYTTMMKQQGTASAVYAVASSGTSLSYPGVLAAKA